MVEAKLYFMARKQNLREFYFRKHTLPFKILFMKSPSCEEPKVGAFTVVVIVKATERKQQLSSNVKIVENPRSRPKID